MRLILQENKDYSDVLKLNYNGSIQAVIVDASTNKLLFSYSNNGLLSDLVRKINFIYLLKIQYCYAKTVIHCSAPIHRRFTAIFN